jgi:hypothetical protein
MDFETYNGIRSIADEMATRITIKMSIIFVVIITIIIILFTILYYNKPKSYENKPIMDEYGRPYLYNIGPDSYINRPYSYDNRPIPYNNSPLNNQNHISNQNYNDNNMYNHVAINSDFNNMSYA